MVSWVMVPLQILLSLKVVDGNVSSVETYFDHLYTDVNGSLLGFGRGKFVLSNNSNANFTSPIMVQDGIPSYDTGISYSAMVLTGSLWTFGRNHHGQLGDYDRLTPVKIVDEM